MQGNNEIAVNVSRSCEQNTISRITWRNMKRNKNEICGKCEGNDGVEETELCFCDEIAVNVNRSCEQNTISRITRRNMRRNKNEICEKCEGNDGVEETELCSCDDIALPVSARLEVKLARGGMNVINVSPRLHPDVMCEDTSDIAVNVSSYSEQATISRITWRSMKRIKNEIWAEKVRALESDEKVSSQDTCIGILQDTEDLLCVGYDVVTLYPDMDTDEAVRGIHEAVMNSPVSFENVDYLECTIYIALNWDQKKCNESELRRVLPVRRGKRGVRPWVKGVGPMGEQRGDAGK